MFPTITQPAPPVAADPQVAQVIARVLDGMQLRDAVREAGLSMQLFHYRLGRDKAAAIAYGRAQEFRADLLADELIAIADSDTDPAKVRNQLTARQWLASKLNARRYGDRIDLNVTQSVDVSATLAEARARLLPVRDLADVIDVDPVVDARAIAAGPSDSQSPSATDAVEPDIFS